MKWVSRPGVRLDRTACIWLILRHIDPQAEILFREPADMVEAFAEGALPFHNTSEEERHLAERTSFEMLVLEYGLAHRDPALREIAETVRAAELGPVHTPPEAAGLLAITRGFYALSASDEEMIALMLPVFDALYAHFAGSPGGQQKWWKAERALSLPGGEKHGRQQHSGR